MKVDGIPGGTAKATTPIPFQTAYRAGDVVVVQAVKTIDLYGGQNEVYLRFPNGEIHATVLKNSFKGKEGDFFSIRIESKTDKQIFAEIVRDRPEPKASYVSVVKLLSSLNVSQTKENKKAAHLILKHGLKPSKDVFLKVVEAIKNNEDLTEDEVAFFIKNNIEINEENKKTYNKFFAKEEKLLIDLLSLIENESTDEELKNAVLKLFKSADEIDREPGVISFDNIAGEILNISFLQKEIDIKKGEEKDGILESFLRFTKLVKAFSQDFIYTQIPVLAGDDKKSVKLCFIKQTKENNGKEKRYLYLNIPTQTLGDIEAIVIVDFKNNIMINFSTQSEEVSKLLKGDILRLYDALKKADFRLLKVTYNEIPRGIPIENLKMYISLMEEKRGFDKRV